MTTPTSMDDLAVDELYQRAREEFETKLTRARSSDDPKRALLEIISPLGEKCQAASIVLYKLVTRARIQQCVDSNLLCKEDWEWHIALREQLEEAVQREIKFSKHVDKDSYVVLRVTFHPLGIAYFTTLCGEEAYQFKPVLHKVTWWDSTRDWGAWRFIRDLPLSMESCLGEPMVTSEWLEIS